MAANIDGIVSGLSTGDLIAQLMRIERQPQVRLEAKRDKVNAVLDAYRSLNTKFAAVRDAATKLTGTGGWDLAKATSSDTTRVTAQAGTGAAAASLTFTVDQLAKAGSAVSSGTVAATSDVVTSLTSIRVTKGSTSTTVNLADGKLSTVVSAINNAGIGVTASAVQVSTGSYKLQVTSTTTGASTNITVDDGAGGNPFASSTLGTMGTLTAGQDAKLQVGGAGGYTVTRSSNTIADLLDGVTLTLLKADTATNVTVDVTADAEGLADRVAKMVDAANAAAGEIKRLTAFDSATNKSGVLQGDSVVRRLQQDLVKAASDAVGGNTIASPGLAGIELGRDGTYTFNRTEFLDQYTKDPAAVEGLLGKGTTDDPGVAGRLEALGKAAVLTGTGRLTTAIAGREDEVRGLGQRIDGWDTRLALRERALRRQFTTMETALGRMRQQSQWLAGQVAGLGI